MKKKTGTPTAALAALLDKTLETARFRDVSNNGLQIGNDGTVTRVAFGVDASLRAFRAAAEAGADCLICHHGLSWGDSLKRITGMNYRLVSFAVRHNLAVYGAHLPLDAHPVYGNNAQLCRLLGIAGKKPAFEYHGEKIGFIGRLAEPLTFEAFCGRVREKVAQRIRTVAFGKERVRTIGVVSGGAADMLEQAAESGADVYLTGEPGLAGYTQAENFGMNAVFAGHYATEVWGVRALERLVRARLGLPTLFLDFDIPF